MKKLLFYDCEISKCIPSGYINPKYEYCKGWGDFENMGIACIGTYSWKFGYRAFLSEELEEFQKLVNTADEIIGFNSISFDDNLLKANGIKIRTTYDLLCEVRIASGQPPHYVRGRTRAGYSLKDLCRANLKRNKSGSGELAPQLWQDGQYEKVISYCLNDVSLLVALYEKRSVLRDPNSGEILFLRDGNPFEHFLIKSFYDFKKFFNSKEDNFDEDFFL